MKPKVQKNKKLVYGSYVTIRSSELQRANVIGARSTSEAAVKIISASPKDSNIAQNMSNFDLALYPNVNELVFRIMPKMQFDALKQIQKLNKELDRELYELLEKRVQTEKNINIAELKNITGKHIQFGGQVQLFHELTQSYVRLTEEKGALKNVFHVCLSNNPSEETHFILTPENSLKKDGDFVTEKDNIIFSCPSNKMRLAFFVAENMIVDPLTMVESTILPKEFDLSKNAAGIVESQLPSSGTYPVCEKNDLFDAVDLVCLHPSRNTSLKKRLTKKNLRVGLTFNCISIDYDSQEGRKELRYGDYVRISHYSKLTYDKGNIVSDSNFCGFSPKAMYKNYINIEEAQKGDLTSVFQLIPPRLDSWGSNLRFSHEYRKKVLLKHFITGRYLYVTPDKEASLSESFSEFAQTWIKQPHHLKQITKAINAKQIEESKAQAAIECFDEFFEKYSIVFAKDKGDDEGRLIINNGVYLSCNEGQCLHIEIKLNVDNEINGDMSPKRRRRTHRQNNGRQCRYYEPNFYESISESVRYDSLIPTNQGSADVFALEHVYFSEISQAIQFSSLLIPIAAISEQKKITPAMLGKAIDSIIELCILLKNPEAEESGDEVLYANIQSNYRELPILDTCVRFLYDYIMFGLNKSSDKDFHNLLNHLILLMQMSCKDNKDNCSYLFQFYSLFVSIILNRVWVTLPSHNCDINLDDLVGALLRTTGYNAPVAEEWISIILEEIRFEKYELKRLNLLIDLFTIQDSKRDPEILRLIKINILDSHKFNDVFKPFVILDGEGANRRIGIKLSETNQLDVANIKDYECLEYIERTVELAKVLCQGYPKIFYDKMSKMLPLEICYLGMTSNLLPAILKSHFLKFYKEMYLAYYFSTIPSSVFPQNLQVHPAELDAEYLIRKETMLEVNKGCESSLLVVRKVTTLQEIGISIPADSGLKQFLLGEFYNPENCVHLVDRPEYLAACLDVIGFLMDKSLLTKIDLAQLKISLFNFLKNSISRYLFYKNQTENPDLSDKKNGDETEDVEGDLKKSTTILAVDNLQSIKSSFVSVADQFNTNNSLQKSSTQIKRMEDLANAVHISVKTQVNLERENIEFIHRILSTLRNAEKMIQNWKYAELVRETKSSKSLDFDFFSVPVISKSKFKEKITQQEVDKAVKTLSQDNEIDAAVVKEQLIESKIDKYLFELLQQKRRFIYALGIDYQQIPDNYTYTLFDLLRIGDLKITELALSLLSDLYENKSSFMKNIGYLQVIPSEHESNISKKLQSARLTFEKLSECISEAEKTIFNIEKYSIDPFKYKDELFNSYQRVSKLLGDILHDVMIPISAMTALNMVAKKISAIYALNVTNFSDLKTTDQKGTFINFFNEFYFDMNYFDLRQKLLANLGFFSTIFHIIISLLEVFEEIPEGTGHIYQSNLNEELLKDKSNDAVTPLQLLMRDLSLQCLILLIYACINNLENQRTIREYIKQHSLLPKLIELYMNRFHTLISMRYFLTFLSAVYCSNLELLLRLPQNDPQVILTIVDICLSELAVEAIEPFEYYLFMTLQNFISFKGLNIFQNSQFILQSITEAKDDRKDKVLNFFQSILPNALRSNPRSSRIMQDRVISRLQLQGDTKVQFIEYPVEVVYSIEMLQFLRKVGSSASKKDAVNIQMLLPIEVIANLLSLKHDWFGLTNELLLFLNEIYLNKTIEESDWEAITEIILNQIPVIIDRISMFSIKEKDLNKSILITLLPDFPNYAICEDTSNLIKNFTSREEYQEVLMCFETGVIPLLKLYTENMITQNQRNDQRTLSRIIRILKPQSKVLNMNKLLNLGLKKSLTSVNHSEHQDIIEEYKQENADELREELNFLIDYKLTETRKALKQGNIDQQLGGSPGASNFYPVSYYSFEILQPEMIDTSDFEFNFFGELMSPKYYKNLQEFDNELLVERFFVLRYTSESSYYSILKVLLKIVDYDFNQKNNKLEALKLIRNLIVEGRKISGCKVVLDFVQEGIIKIICDALIKFNKDYDFCSELISILMLILQEEEEEIQETLFTYLTQVDKKNEFIISISEYIEAFFKGFESSITLKNNMKAYSNQTSDWANLRIIESEVEEYKMRMINCLEMLRLMCENHYENLQNFLREQKIGLKKRFNSINMILFVADLLHRYNRVIDQSNVDLGEKFFEYFIELLQGPCFPNQKEVCDSRLMETVEDLLIQLIDGGDEKNTQPRSRSKATFATLGHKSVKRTSFLTSRRTSATTTTMKPEELERLYNTSNIIQNIITFMCAVMEATDDRMVIEKMKIHCHYELLLQRLSDIYNIFKTQITSNQYSTKLITAVKRLVPISTFKEETRVSRTSGTSRGTLSDDDDGIYPLKVLIERDGVADRDYNPIIHEGIKIWILLSTLGDIDADFNKTLHIAIANLLGEGGEGIGMVLGGATTSSVIEYFDKKVKSIEIINHNGKLQRVFFPYHCVAEYLSEFSKSKFSEEVPRENENDKIKSIFYKFEDFYDEMKHFQHLNSIGIAVNLNIFNWLKQLSLSLVFLIHFIQMFSDPESRHGFSGSVTDRFIQLLGIVIMGIYIVIFILWIILNAHLDNHRIWKLLESSYNAAQKIRRPDKRSLALFSVFRDYTLSMLYDTELLDLLFNLIFATLGIWFSRIFFSFMLLEIIGRSELLKNVIKSITLNTFQLFMTAILGMVIIFIFTSIVYFTGLKKMTIFMEDETFRMCENYIHCYLTHIGFGLRSGGGIGDVIGYPDYQEDTYGYIARFSFDFIFFVMVILIYFNIVSGIIIDTFSELRSKKEEKGKTS